KKIFGFSFVLFLLISLVGCKVIVEPEASNSLPDNSAATFSTIQKEVFNVSCALSGCHSGTDAAAGMDLSADKAFNNLVNVSSTSNTNFVRVQPGNSANSFIIKRLRNTGESSGIMPPSGKLSENTIQLVETWINNGAKND
ncbi:MAG: c-type cytochrome domain-containing protein, partial [Ignavibacteria bacterium]|nr:c-type cytochrome domain-containing protein [Ignavibacteria bacterium]